MMQTKSYVMKIELSIYLLFHNSLDIQLNNYIAIFSARKCGMKYNQIQRTSTEYNKLQQKENV